MKRAIVSLTTVGFSLLIPSTSLAQIVDEPTYERLDIPPTHWAYPAVVSLIERYGCISGYPDGTFRGDQFVTRYEAAAAFSSCFDRILEVTQSQQDAERQESLELRRSMEELRDELGGLEQQVDELEGGK